MKTVIQRVSRASVSIKNEQVGAIQKGLLVLVGIHESDNIETIKWMNRKIVNMRIFEDADGKMNVSAKDIGGAILLVPQFTLYADAEKGNRPSFTEAAPPAQAKKIFHKMVEAMKSTSSLPIETGQFGAYMNVELINDGPVTIILDH